MRQQRAQRPINPGQGSEGGRRLLRLLAGLPTLHIGTGQAAHGLIQPTGKVFLDALDCRLAALLPSLVGGIGASQVGAQSLLLLVHSLGLGFLQRSARISSLGYDS